jgi:hypothetical protein
MVIPKTLPPVLVFEQQRSLGGSPWRNQRAKLYKSSLRRLTDAILEGSGQTEIPVIWRPGGKEPLRIRLAHTLDILTWLTIPRKRRPIWKKEGRYWDLPANRFNDLVDQALNEWPAVYVIQPYREQEKCAPACWNAVGHQCQCSCMGQRHGTGYPGGRWFVVSETFALQWGDRKLACRLLTQKARKEGCASSAAPGPSNKTA